MSKRPRLENPTIPKSFTQLQISHFFRKKPSQTVKKPTNETRPDLNTLRKGTTDCEENPIEINEGLMKEIDEFLIKESSSSKSNSLMIKPPEKSNKTPEKSLQLDFEERKSMSNSRFADELIKGFERSEKDDQLKILSKQENLFQIRGIFENISIMSIPEEVSARLEGQSLDTPFKVLVLRHAVFCQNSEFIILLKGKWSALKLRINNYVEAFGQFSSSLLLCISNETSDSFLIYEPSLILYPTIILDSHKCLRRGVLSLNMGKTGGSNLPLVIGSLAHSLFETAFNSHNEGKKITYEFLKSVYIELLKNFIEELFILGKNEKDLIQIGEGQIRNIADWFKEYIYEGKEWVYCEKTGRKMRILRVLGPETMIVAGNLGLKGQVDAILYCEIKDQSGSIKQAFLPFELKTGKEYYLHFYQGFLYCLLLQRKYEQPLFLTGFFYYLKENRVLVRSGNDNDMVDLLIRRNSLAYAVREYEAAEGEETPGLPEMLRKNVRECGFCPFNADCSAIDLSYNLENASDIEDFPVYNTVRASLSLVDKAYIRKWFSLLKTEENCEKGKRNSKQEASQELNFQAFELESTAKLKELILAIKSKSRLFEEKFSLSFTCKLESQDSIISLYESIAGIDQAIIKQPETKLILKATIERRKVIEENARFLLRLEARFQLKEFELSIDKFDELLELLEFTPSFFLEKYDKTYYPNLRSNVLSLILDPKFAKLKRLIVDNDEPRFENIGVFENCAFENILAEYRRFDLNPDQIESIRKSLLADDYNLILGMPGTGKTHTLAILIKILHDFGFKILISCYTHSALDNILIKFLDLFPECMDFCLRYTKSHHEIHEKIAKTIYRRESFNSTAEIKNFFEKKTLVFVTTLSVGGSAIRDLQFDYCIIEEASQTIEPLIVAPLMKAFKFILIGDYYQLQPLVKSREESGLKVSLFERLCKNDFTKVSMLRYQVFHLS